MSADKEEEKKKKWYFTQEHEDAIVKYAKNNDIKIRSELYKDLINPVFTELIDNIVYTYKFHDLPNIDNLKEECKIWLTTQILGKFDPDKGSKAFNYFTVCVRNWFIQKCRKRGKSLRKETNYDNMPQHIEEEYFSIENTYDEDREKAEFLLYLRDEMDKWDKGYRGRILGDNDLKVVDAVRTVFDNASELEVFTKKGIYIYLREITGLNTKQITRSLNKLRERYDKFRDRWEECDVE